MSIVHSAIDMQQKYQKMAEKQYQWLYNYQVIESLVNSSYTFETMQYNYGYV